MTPPSNGPDPARHPNRTVLSAGEVDVWQASVSAFVPSVAGLVEVLSDDERARASRFRFERHRDAFVVSRAVLRRLLAPYVGRAPEALRFHYGPYGKPALLTEPDDPDVRFNLSHSGDVVLVAVAGARDVGVDVEVIRPDRVTEAIARRFFAPREVAALTELPSELRVAAFYNCWSRKEAYIKAIGSGVTLGLDRFCVTLAPGEEAALVETGWRPSDVGRWSMQALDVGPGYAAALVVERPAGRVCLRRYVPEA